MALRFALCFLSFVILLLITNGHGSSGRDTKEPQVEAEQKEVNQAYITQYGTKPVSKGRDPYFGYKAAYTSNEKNTQGNSPVSDQPYLTGYRTSSAQDSNKPYITAYGKNSDASNQPYITSYGGKPSRDLYSGYKAAYTSEKPISRDPYSGYKAAYTSKKPISKDPYSGYKAAYTSEKPAFIEQAGYKAIYTSEKPISKDPYFGYKAAYTSEKPISRDPYSGHKAAYTTEKPVSKDPYFGYKAAYTSEKPISREPYSGYKAAYTSEKPVSKDPYFGYKAAYTSEKPISRDPYSGYKAAYTSKKPIYKDSYFAYNAIYTSRRHIHPFHQPYLTGYITSQKDQKEMNEPYITQYGGNDKAKKDSRDSYAATYRKTGQDLEGSSSKVDHTEAFKTGFFSLEDVYVGNRMTLHFHVQDFPHFLQRKEADTIPFSMSQLPSVLQLFSINEDSDEAQAMKDTHEQCDAPTLTGETKVCATSLESMLEFVRSILGTDSSYEILTTSYPTASSVPLQNYTILRVSEDIYAPKWVTCHPLPYPYAVFFCHYIGTGSKIFKVLLGGENGNQMEALGLCHLDTSEWTPEHVIFQQLGTKPGASPICHFLPVKHLVWVPLPSKAAM